MKSIFFAFVVFRTASTTLAILLFYIAAWNLEDIKLSNKQGLTIKLHLP